MKKILLRSIVVIILLGAAAFVYMRFIEPSWLQANVYKVHLLKNKDGGLRILHISDLHSSEFVDLTFIHRAIDLGISQKPDLIV